MESLKLSVFALAVLAFVFQVEWLAYSLVAVLLGLLYFNYAPVKHAKQGAHAPAHASREPVIIQSNPDTTAYDFVTGLVNGLVNDPTSNETLGKRHAELSKKVDKTGEKLSAQIKDLSSKLEGKKDGGKK